MSAYLKFPYSLVLKSLYNFVWVYLFSSAVTYKFMQSAIYTKGSPDKEWEEAADMHRRRATKCLLLCSWVGKKSLRNLESHSLKNDRCLIISHKLETFLWKQLKTNCPNQPVQRLQSELYFWAPLHMHKYIFVGTGLTTFPSLSAEHIILPVSD